MDCLGVSSLLRDVRPDVGGFQPSFLYVLLCMLCPVVLGVVSVGVTAALEKLTGRSRTKVENDA